MVLRDRGWRPRNIDPTPRHGSGVLYVATGAPYVKLAEASARSLRKHSPGLAVHLFTDLDVAPGECFDSVDRIDDPHRRSKVDHVSRTPFARTLFLDADTRVQEDIADLFDLLDVFDLAAAHAPRRNADAIQARYSPGPPTCFPPLNSGVLLYRSSPAVITCLERWAKAFHEATYEKDQATLRDLLWETSLRVMVLPPEYNLHRTADIAALAEFGIRPKILHLQDFKRQVGLRGKRRTEPGLLRRLRRRVRRAVR